MLENVTWGRHIGVAHVREGWSQNPQQSHVGSRPLLFCGQWFSYSKKQKTPDRPYFGKKQNRRNTKRPKHFKYHCTLAVVTKVNPKFGSQHEKVGQEGGVSANSQHHASETLINLYHQGFFWCLQKFPTVASSSVQISGNVPAKSQRIRV